MDVFSHGLYSMAMLYPKYKTNRAQRYIAALFGVVPDIIPFTPPFLYMLVNRWTYDPIFFFPDPQHWVFDYALYAYNFTHSLVVFGIIALLVTVIRKGKFYLPMIAWLVHILMDIPTHPNFFKTPFLFPISDYQVSWGYAWSTPRMLLVNAFIVLLVYIPILWDISKRKGFKTFTFLNAK